MSLDDDAARHDSVHRQSVTIEPDLIQLAQRHGHDPEAVRKEVERVATEIATVGPRGRKADGRVVAVLAAWLAISALLLLGMLILLWDENAIGAKEAGRISVLVVLAGCLGGTVSALIYLLTSYEQVGALYLREVPTLVFLPLVAAALSLVFYYVIRGGLLASPAGTDGGSDVINVYGVVGISALVGLFFSGAMSKLRDVSDALFGVGSGSRREGAPDAGISR